MTSPAAYPEFKREAVTLETQLERSLSAIAQVLGIERSMLNRWVENIAPGKFENDAKLPLKSAQQQQHEHLRRGLAKVKIVADRKY